MRGLPLRTNFVASTVNQFCRPALTPTWSLARGLKTSQSEHVSEKLHLLEHRHLVSNASGSFVPYDDAQLLQEDLRAKFLTWKSLPENERAETSPPRPHLFSFESAPTFTLGRRQEPLSPDQQNRLQSALRVRLPHRKQQQKQQDDAVSEASFSPDVRKTNRGGLTTYHGPGQLVLWPVLDMHSPLYERYSVLSYASHLEATTQRLLLALFDIPTYTSRDEPGVWVKGSDNNSQPRKIAALGVHHRRHVTALGIAVNIDVPVIGDETVNPWARFVPCGLDDKLVTSVVAEKGEAALSNWDIPQLADSWAKMFDEGLRDSRKRGTGDELRRVI